MIFTEDRCIRFCIDDDPIKFFDYAEGIRWTFDWLLRFTELLVKNNHIHYSSRI